MAGKTGTGAAALPACSPSALPRVLSAPGSAGPCSTPGMENGIFLQHKAKGISIFWVSSTMQVKWKEGSVWLECLEEKGERAQEGAGTRAGFRNREGGREMEEGLPAAAGAAREQEIEKIRVKEGGGRGRRGQK